MHEIFTSLPRGFTLAIIIIFGAFVHATSQLKLARANNDVFTWKDFLVLLPISMFSGWMFSLMALWILPSGSDTFISLCAGIGAFMGIAGLNRVAAVLLDFAEERITNRKKK